MCGNLLANGAFFIFIFTIFLVIVTQYERAFAAHLSTSKKSREEMIKKGLMIDKDIDVLLPYRKAISAFKQAGFSIKHFSIGHLVFPGYEAWVKQVIQDKHNPTWKILQTYKQGYIDYYLFVGNQL